MSLHTAHETVLRRKQTHLAPFQTDSYMSERDLRSRSDLISDFADERPRVDDLLEDLIANGFSTHYPTLPLKTIWVYCTQPPTMAYN